MIGLKLWHVFVVSGERELSDNVDEWDFHNIQAAEIKYHRHDCWQ
jgi:hypothetical protein